MAKRGTKGSAADKAASATRKTQPDGRRGILVRANPEAWRALKQIALDTDVTLQALMEQAINDLLKKHRKPPLA
jgi:hypothetical protein